MARKEELRVELTATDKLSKVVSKAAKAVDDLDGETAEVEVTADAEKAEEAIEAVDKLVDELDGKTAEATLSAEDQAKAEIDEVMKRLADLDDEEVIAVLSAKATKLEAEVKNANALLSKLDGENAEAIISAKDQASANLRAVRSRLDDLQGGFKNVNTSGTQSRSVLANLAGNSAQDLGELGGVVGSLGVGVGQLAEYAVDGNIKMKELAKVAAPMAGIALATMAIGEAFKALNAEKAFNAQLVEDFAAALRDGQTVAQSLLETIQETGELNFETGIFGGGGLIGLGSETKNLIELFATMGLTYEDFVRLLEDPTGAAQLRDMKDEFLNMALAADEDGFQELGDTYQEQAEAARDAADGLEDYQASTAAAIDSQAELDQFLGRSSDALTRLNERLAEHRDPMETLPELWDALIQDAKDGTLEWENAAGAVEQLTEATGESEEAIISRIEAEAAKALEAEADAAEEAAQKLEEQTAAANEARAAVGDGLVPALTEAAEATREHADALRNEAIAALEEQQEALEETIETLESYIGAQRDAYDTQIDYREATEDAEDALADYNNALIETDEETGELTHTQEEINDLGEDFVQTVLAQSDALIDQKRAQAEANGAIYSGTQAISDQNAALLATAHTIPNELLPQFAEMIATINGIPEEKETILTMLREGVDPAEILGYLNGISKTFAASVTVTADQNAINNIATQLAQLAKPIHTKVYTSYYGGIKAKAAGGPVAAGVPYTVGERGTELFVPGQDGTIIPAHQTSALLNGHLTPASHGGIGSVGDTYVTVNMPPGSNGEDVLRALQRVQRTHGPLPLRIAG